MIDKNSNNSCVQGTLEYLSPEVLRSSSTVSRAADMWSVGVIVYMLVTGGVSPFFAGTRLKTMMRLVIQKVFEHDIICVPQVIKL